VAATARKSAINTLALYSRFFCNVSNAVRFCGDPDSLTDVVQIAGFKRAVYVGRNIFVIGDAAASSGWDGGSVPGLAPAAQQGGRYVARMIRARLEARGEPPPFVYRHRGSLATIGRKAAVADFGRIRLWGAPAWWLWGMVHVSFLATMRNRVSVIIAWIWAYLTFRSGTRLITGQDMPEETA